MEASRVLCTSFVTRRWYSRINSRVAVEKANSQTGTNTENGENKMGLGFLNELLLLENGPSKKQFKQN